MTSLVSELTKNIRRFAEYINRRIVVPSPSWTTEVYGLGKALRELTKYPESLKIFAVMTHGVNFEPRLYPHEVNSISRIYLGWHPLVADCNKEISGKRILRIPHPWPGYRAKRGYRPRTDGTGTIVFFPHTTPDTRLEWQPEEYLESLQSLDAVFKPITICLHYHDLTTSTKRLIESFGMSWTSVGNPFDPAFVDKFYEMISAVRFSTSPSWGSHVAYCINFGIPFFYYGSDPRPINVSDPNMTVGEIKHQSIEALVLKAEADRLFGSMSLLVTSEQLDFVNRLLGQDATVSYRKLRLVLTMEYLLAWWRSLSRAIIEKWFRYN